MIETFVHNAWLVPALPLLGAIVAAVGGRWLKALSHIPVVAGIALAFVVSLFLLAGVGGEAEPTLIPWVNALGLRVPIQFRVDGLTTMMLSMVTFVATVVAVFASGYMAGDPGYPRFFALVGLFVASMTGLVLSSNYILTYAFWEGVGVCSYLLVGFWHSKPSAAAAAKKAFMVNRVGDVGFAIGLFWLWSVVPGHDLSYQSVLSEGTLAILPHATKLGIALLFFWAATAKSAQVPLYVWLPDAMEGPTPVSAPHPRGDDGHGGRLPDRPVDPAARPGARGTGRRRGHRRADGPAGRADRADADRPQAGDGVLDREPARLHVHGPGRRRGQARGLRRDRGYVPSVHARVLQGVALSGLGQRDARDGRRDRHATVRRA